MTKYLLLLGAYLLKIKSKGQHNCLDNLKKGGNQWHKSALITEFPDEA